MISITNFCPWKPLKVDGVEVYFVKTAIDFGLAILDFGLEPGADSVAIEAIEECTRLWIHVSPSFSQSACFGILGRLAEFSFIGIG
ncbi:MAG: hypothetical protein VKJ24_14900 [Synechococcales bacterium]|nr:hypothetical protein [Synechococcales bacterium]